MSPPELESLDKQVKAMGEQLAHLRLEQEAVWSASQRLRGALLPLIGPVGDLIDGPVVVMEQATDYLEAVAELLRRLEKEKDDGNTRI